MKTFIKVIGLPILVVVLCVIVALILKNIL
jgi:hypothetical protein